MKRGRYVPKPQLVRYFFLEGLLEGGQRLAVNVTASSISLLVVSEALPCELLTQHFTPREIELLLLLLEEYPLYCPYEVLQAQLHFGNIQEHNVEQSRNQILEAREMGVWEQVLRPLKYQIAHCRAKMLIFAISIPTVHETGYQLQASRKPVHTVDIS